MSETQPGTTALLRALLERGDGGRKIPDAVHHCEIHGEYQTIDVEIAGRVLAGHCPLCLVDRTASTSSPRNVMSQRLRTSGIPSRFQAKTFENYITSIQGQKDALSLVRDFVDSWDECRTTGTSLILAGTIGTGKTHLAAAAGQALLNMGLNVRWTRLTPLSEQIRSTYRQQHSSEQNERAIMNALREADLLIIDDVGEDNSPHPITLTHQLICDRYEAGDKPLLITTNIPWQKLAEKIGTRAHSRLEEHVGYQWMQWESFRARH